MKAKSNKPGLGVFVLLSLLIMAVAVFAGCPGVAVSSGFVLFVLTVVACSRIIDGCENSILNDCA